MNDIKNFIYCESVGTTPMPDGTVKNIISQPFISIGLKFVPTLYSFAVTFGIDNITEIKDIRLIFKEKSSLSIIFDTGVFPFAPPPQIDQKPITEAWASLSIINVQIQNTGEYITEVQINGCFAGEYTIIVRRSE